MTLNQWDYFQMNKKEWSAIIINKDTPLYSIKFIPIQVFLLMCELTRFFVLLCIRIFSDPIIFMCWHFTFKAILLAVGDYHRNANIAIERSRCYQLEDIYADNVELSTGNFTSTTTEKALGRLHCTLRNMSQWANEHCALDEQQQSCSLKFTTTVMTFVW